ncbi:DUF5058 family protein [Zhenpiania hominis]|uniref:DUF5058 family protein n=1 Tax=Zhenpiania hominis TaxID=2763644 RepID=A0A923NKZ3_9FIRM|nr:DUF5058 family protein [Zhenpiania hominis]MBC6679845.1 DUF5058 family protein [Zhenpiania hominis]
MENLNALEVANSPAVWALASIAVIAVLVETILFLRLARKAAGLKEINLTKKQCNRALRAGVVSAIGPAFGVFIVMIGLISVLGGPISWLRLSVIGGATTELTAATVGVNALGGDISEPLSMMELSNAWWTMSINACGWLVVTWIFGSRMEKVRNRIGGGDSRWMEIFSSAATLGIFGAFCSEYVVTGIQSVDYKVVLVMAVSAAAMWALQQLSNRWKWLKEYCLGLAMVAGIASAMIF